MRKFIISDIHGFGPLYYSIMYYLDNVNNDEEVELYINGDLIDRGIESSDVLLDVIKRINDNRFKIVYLGGNHELMMYQTYKMRMGIGQYIPVDDWYNNGGNITDLNLATALNYDKNKLFQTANFIGNLNIYHKFDEKIKGKNIVLVHALCPSIVKDECNLKIKDDNEYVFSYVWARKGIYPFKYLRNIGNKDYFTIIGHTPVLSKTGFEYTLDDNALNIDGGTSCFTAGYFNYNKFPLVELKDNYLKIYGFNENNEITYGYYFDGTFFYKCLEDELNKERNFLNKEYKPKKLIKLKDNNIGYE